MQYIEPEFGCKGFEKTYSILIMCPK